VTDLDDAMPLDEDDIDAIENGTFRPTQYPNDIKPKGYWNDVTVDNLGAFNKDE